MTTGLIPTDKSNKWAHNGLLIYYKFSISLKPSAFHRYTGPKLNMTSSWFWTSSRKFQWVFAPCCLAREKKLSVYLTLSYVAFVGNHYMKVWYIFCTVLVYIWKKKIFLLFLLFLSAKREFSQPAYTEEIKPKCDHLAKGVSSLLVFCHKW